MEDKKETRGIYNTTFNEKKATLKKKIEEMKRLKNKLEEDGKDAQSLHNETSSHGRMVCQSTLSSPSTEILPQTDKSQEVQPSQKPSQLTKNPNTRRKKMNPLPIKPIKGEVDE